MAEDKQWPFFLAPLRGVLERLRPPAGTFDPNGAWEHRYAVCVLAPERGARGEHPQPYGTLALGRKPIAGGGFALEVDLSISTRGRSGMRSRASLMCADDRFGTPRQWELRSETIEQGRPVADLTVVKRGSGDRNGTSNWSLLEAVQRLPFDAAPVSFDMLEDLDLRKPGQTLRPVDAVTLELGGRAVRLHGFRQTGRGILPTHYWLDERHRLIAVSGGLRGLVWAPRESA